MNKFVIIYLIIINITAFLAYGIDKQKARHKKWRIPEKTLLSLALLGGALGALIGMLTFHHKTRKLTFIVCVPLLLLIECGLFYLISCAG